MAVPDIFGSLTTDLTPLTVSGGGHQNGRLPLTRDKYWLQERRMKKGRKYSHYTSDLKYCEVEWTDREESSLLGADNKCYRPYSDHVI